MTLSPEAVSPAELVNRCRVLSERVAQHNRRMKADEQALGSEVDTAYRELRSQIESSNHLQRLCVLYKPRQRRDCTSLFHRGRL